MIGKKDLESIPKFIQQDDPVRMVESAMSLGQTLVNEDLSNSQFRTIYGQIRQIAASWRIEDQHESARRHLLLIKPRISYQAKKDGKEGVKSLRDILNISIDAVFDGDPDSSTLDTRFHRFADFFEAVLAYHRASDKRTGK